MPPSSCHIAGTSRHFSLALTRNFPSNRGRSESEDDDERTRMVDVAPAAGNYRAVSPSSRRLPLRTATSDCQCVSCRQSSATDATWVNPGSRYQLPADSLVTALISQCESETHALVGRLIPTTWVNYKRKKVRMFLLHRKLYYDRFRM